MKTPTLALFHSFTLALFACGASDDTPVDTDTGELTPISWRHCGVLRDRDIRCAEIAVPVDHDNPDGETIEIAINRIGADPSVPYRGVLFVNPGGPGGGGKEFALDLAVAGATDVLTPGFDVVGFDPRGVADSGERACGAVPASRMAVETVQDYVTRTIVDGQRCANAWGSLFDHLGSKQVVRDMEALRIALGEAKLNFLGVSYGTRLGSLYAHMYPESTGSIVLDSATTPDMDLMKETRENFNQLLVLQEVFFQDCDAGVLDCPPDARALFDGMIADATELGREGEMAQRWANALAYPWSREGLPLLLERQAIEADPSWIDDELSQPGVFDGIAAVANRTVTCIDATAEPPSIAEFTDLYYEFAEQSPLFAFRAYGALQCTGWPVTRDPVPMPDAPTAPPVLVIGGTQDLLTPLSNAQEMSAALGNATLLVSNHYGHGAISPDHGCVLDAVINYFADGRLPPQGTICEP